MVGGFNTNVRYAGRLFHVQTEDSGRRRPKIVTLLYEGGTILTSRKSSYEDQLDSADLEGVVRDLMEAQHRALVDALKDGDLDEAIGLEAETGTQVAGGDARPRRSSVEKPQAPRSGKSAPSFGSRVISDRTLDEVILEHLAAR
jgi:hypothetical protein